MITSFTTFKKSSFDNCYCDEVSYKLQTGLDIVNKESSSKGNSMSACLVSTFKGEPP
jgi:hypothetical protein